MTRVILASASPRRRELLAALISDFEVLPADVPEPLTGDPHENARRLAADKAAFVARDHPGAVVIGADTIVHVDGVSYGKPRDAADATRILRELRGRSHHVVTGVAVAEAGAYGLQTPANDESACSGRRPPSPAAAGGKNDHGPERGTKSAACPATAPPRPAHGERGPGGEGCGGHRSPPQRAGSALGGLHVSSSETTVSLSDLPDARVSAYVASGRPLDKAGAYAIQDADVPTVASFDGCYCNVVGLPLWRLRALLRSCGLETREPHLSITRCSDCPERDASRPPA